MRPSATCAASIAALVVSQTSKSTGSAFGVNTPAAASAAATAAGSNTAARYGPSRLNTFVTSPGTTVEAKQRIHISSTWTGKSPHAKSSSACRIRSHISSSSSCTRVRQRRRVAVSMATTAGGGSGGGDGERGLLDRFLREGKKWLAGAALAGTILGGGTILSPAEPSSAATPEQTKEIGLCLLKECRGELAQCILNPKCFANIICLQTCNGRADEGYCQIRCGDLFENEAVGKFNACAVSKKNCVKQRQDDGSWPVPPMEAQVEAFDPKMMQGQWYISAGLNPAFDCFDCQVHFFNSPKPGQLVGKLNWRIKEPDGEFFTRDVMQKFQQDSDNPAHLVNKDNDYLHYRDDWYVLDAVPNSHVLVVYRGSNDAWDGYGGGTLYTKEKTVPPGIIERVKAKSEAAGIDWSRWRQNDNTCKPQEASEALREKYAKKLLKAGGNQLQEQLTVVRGAASQGVVGVEESTLEALEELKQTYEVEVEQLSSDLATAFEAELEAFERGLEGEVKTLTEGAVRVEEGAAQLIRGEQ